MKKLVLSVLMVFTLAFSANCFAAGAASDFRSEEKAADAFVAALVAPDTAGYKAASGSFAQNLKEALTEENFKALQKQIKDKVGRLKTPDFVNYKRVYDLKNGYTGVDELSYIANVRGNKFAQITVLFVTEKGKPQIVNFLVNPFEVTEKAEAPAK